MSRLTAVIVVLAIAGAILAGLAMGEHYNTQPAPCDINSHWDCGIVNHTPYAVLFGIPVALIGIAGYCLLAALAGRYRRLTAVLAVLAFLFSLRLTIIEWRTIQIWCLYCVGSQLVIAALMLVALIEARRPA